MATISKISNGEGEKRLVGVETGGYVKVQQSEYPPNDDRDLQIIYRNFLTLNNDGTTTSMLVDGSTTSQLFYIQADPINDIYITSLSIIIQANGISLGQDFAGDGTGLVNGFRIYYEDKTGEINIGTDLTTNFDFIRLCQGNPAFGTDDGVTDTAFIIPNLSTGGAKGKNPADGIIPVLDINTVFGFEYGLKLFRGTNNRLVFEINDDLTTNLGVDAGMNVIAYGFERKFN